MEIGASSSCFYPLETEKSFSILAGLGIKNCEIFFNSRSELKKAFVGELKKIKDSNGMKVISLHPYASFSEGYNFFSRYERRYSDAVEEYKKLFEAAAELGAEYIVLHGSKNKPEISLCEYAERFWNLNKVAHSFGVTVAHENVVHYASEYPGFMKFMHEKLGDGFKSVLDVKQARRAGVDPMEFVEIMGNNIVHVHLSDYSKEQDCIPPCEKGLFDFEALFRKLEGIDYKGRYVIEVYSDSFKQNEEILMSAKYLDSILKNVKEGS